MRYLHRSAIGFALVLAVLGTLGPGPSAQPQDESAAAMDARLAAATVARVGPSYLYPDPAVTPGMVNPDITQANIAQTICTHGWTATVRPPVSYTNKLKTQQLAAAHASDNDLSHWEEDHLVSLELGGHPRDPRNLWLEPWRTPAQPLTSRGPFPAHLVGAKAKDVVENRLHKEVCDGTVVLREAPYIIATDWFKSYREKVPT